MPHSAKRSASPKRSGSRKSKKGSCKKHNSSKRVSSWALFVKEIKNQRGLKSLGEAMKLASKHKPAFKKLGEKPGVECIRKFVADM